MDNKQNRQFYWEVKEFVNTNHTPKAPEVKKTSLKQSISGVINENNPYKQSNFIQNTKTNDFVRSYLHTLSDVEKKNIPSSIIYTKNQVSNPFNVLNEGLHNRTVADDFVDFFGLEKLKQRREETRQEGLKQEQELKDYEIESLRKVPQGERRRQMEQDYEKRFGEKPGEMTSTEIAKKKEEDARLEQEKADKQRRHQESEEYKKANPLVSAEPSSGRVPTPGVSNSSSNYSGPAANYFGSNNQQRTSSPQPQPQPQPQQQEQPQQNQNEPLLPGQKGNFSDFSPIRMPEIRIKGSQNFNQQQSQPLGLSTQNQQQPQQSQPLGLSTQNQQQSEPLLMPGQKRSFSGSDVTSSFSRSNIMGLREQFLAEDDWWRKTKPNKEEIAKSMGWYYDPKTGNALSPESIIAAQKAGVKQIKGTDITGLEYEKNPRYKGDAYIGVEGAQTPYRPVFRSTYSTLPPGTKLPSPSGTPTQTVTPTVAAGSPAATPAPAAPLPSPRGSSTVSTSSPSPTAVSSPSTGISTTLGASSATGSSSSPTIVPQTPSRFSSGQFANPDRPWEKPRDLPGATEQPIYYKNIGGAGLPQPTFGRGGGVGIMDEKGNFAESPMDVIRRITGKYKTGQGQNQAQVAQSQGQPQVGQAQQQPVQSAQGQLSNAGPNVIMNRPGVQAGLNAGDQQQGTQVAQGQQEPTLRNKFDSGKFEFSNDPAKALKQGMEIAQSYGVNALDRLGIGGGLSNIQPINLQNRMALGTNQSNIAGFRTSRNFV